jgi:polysaccharide deacetylase family protein (PEP-CTERM system associated)
MNLATAIDLSEDYASGVTCNAMSVDVEDYFQVSAFDSVFPRSQWSGMPWRIEQNVDKVLRIFAERGAQATFFTLGCVAERFPQMIRAIADGGHEIASHGWEHHKVFTQTAQEFRDDVVRTRKLLQDLSGQPVIGYRAASFSVDHRTPWAHAVLAEAGHTYSSSIYPVAHDHYGVPEAPRGPFRDGEQGILEIPASTIRRFGRNWPVAGGGFFRLYPLAASLWAIGQVNGSDKLPAVFYFHPWELDPDQPRVSGINRRTRFRHYLNLSRFESRLGALLNRFSWGRMDKVFGVGS